MKKKSISKKLLKVILWIVGVVAVLAIAALLTVRYVVVPKITQKLQQSGMEEIAVLVENSNNISTLVEVAEVITDKGVIDFISNLDTQSVSSTLDLLEDIQKELDVENTDNTATDNTNSSENNNVSVGKNETENVGVSATAQNATAPQPSQTPTETPYKSPFLITPTFGENLLDNLPGFINNNISTALGQTIPPTTSVPTGRPMQLTTPAPSTATNTALPTSSPSLQDDATEAYERISKVATPQELTDGLNLIKKLDMGYISSLISGGLTPEEKSELKDYIYSKLTNAEISRALKLYSKYKQYL